MEKTVTDLELVVFVRYKDSDELDTIEITRDVYSEDIEVDMKEKFLDVSFLLDNFVELDVVSDKVEEVYMELQGHSEGSEGIQLLDQYSLVVE